MRRIALAIALLCGMMLLHPGRAEAACALLSLCSCTASASGVSFAGYDPTSTVATDSSGTVTVNCVLVVALAGSFTIDLGTGSSGSYAARTMANGTSTLRYNLFTDDVRSTIWGNGTGGSSEVPVSFTALLAVNRTLTVYGRIPARQNVPSGPYSDTIVVTVTY